MTRWRTAVLYFVLLPAVAVAACILGYYTYQTALQYQALGEQSIAQSTLMLVRDKVDRVEQQIITADNAVFHLVEARHPKRIADTWPPLAERISPSVRTVMIFDPSGEALLGFASRAPRAEHEAFLEFYRTHVAADLALDDQPVNQLGHLHRDYDGQNYLFSFRRVQENGGAYLAVAHHDTGYLLREVFPALIATTPQDELLIDVVDENDRDVFGPSLARSGDYLVGLRFPTTLYGWRLQAAPPKASELERKGRSKNNNEGALLALSFGVVLLGFIFLIYAAQQERRLNALKSEFIANVSHELKTPLSVVRMFGEMLLSGRVKSEEKQREYLETICRESERLTALIENVLDFAAVERGKQVYDIQRHDVADIVARAIDTFRYRVEREGTDLSLEVLGERAQVDVDADALLLAVINLLDNAVKYGGGSPVDVVVEARSREVQIRVRDRGQGIPEDDLRRVFERFYRTNRGGSVRGSGIGLALVKQIAEAHGGRAFAKNASDGGAVVCIGLPVAARAKQRAEDRAPLAERA